PRPPVAAAEYDALVATLRSTVDSFESVWEAGASRTLAETVSAVSRGRGPRNRPQAGWASLTPTELSVVDLVRAGLSNPDIAARLFMSRGTVKAHLARIYAKVGVANRTELATAATTRD